MTPALLVVPMFVVMGIAVPVGIAMGVTGALGLYQVGGWSMVEGVFSTVPLSSVSTYELLTIPMFLLMAEFILLSGVADDIFKAMRAWTGRLPGGLAIATTLAGAAFGAICGTSTASAATLSATTLPAMIKQGYEPRMAAGVVAISGTLAMLVPPSVAIILFGLIAEVSIGKLLIASLIPALLVTLTIVLTILTLVWRDPSRAPPAERIPWEVKLATLKVAVPVFFLFGLVTGSIYLGIASETEASALGAVGGLLLVIQRRKLSMAGLSHALERALLGTCMIFMIIMGASLFTYFFTFTQITQNLVLWVGALEVNRWVIIAVLLVGYLILGCFMDQIAILVLTIPVVIPIVKALGFDPIWFGIIKVVTAEVGMITPPLGLNCFIVARYAKRPVEEVFRGSLPHFVAHLVIIAVLVAFPQLTLWLPEQMR